MFVLYFHVVFFCMWNFCVLFSACENFELYLPRLEFFLHVEFSSYISMCGNSVWYFPRMEFSCSIFCVWNIHDIFSMCIIVFHVWNFCVIFFCVSNYGVIFSTSGNFMLYFLCVGFFHYIFCVEFFLSSKISWSLGKRKLWKMLISTE